MNDRGLDNSLYMSVVGDDINNITGQTMGDNTPQSPIGTPEAPRDEEEDMHKEEDSREKESEEDSDDLSRKRKRQSELGGQGQRQGRGLAKKPRQQEDGSHSGGKIISILYISKWTFNLSMKLVKLQVVLILLSKPNFFPKFPTATASHCITSFMTYVGHVSISIDSRNLK